MGKYMAVIRMVEATRLEERKRACILVRKNCAACLGTGIFGETTDADGEPESTECEYCGRAIRAIRENL